MTPQVAHSRGLSEETDYADIARGNQVTLRHNVAMFSGAGGSLWPVTESEPGRVAKLRAIGNAVVPLWCVMGPFARIMELEAGQPSDDGRAA